MIERSEHGINDLDLLIDRSDESRFTAILSRLDFKPAIAPTYKQMPGVVDFFGYDEGTDQIIHAHAHYQLMVGHDLTKNYRLLIEHPYLDSAVQNGLFKIPSPEFEYIVFVIRMVLKHATWDSILGREGSLKKAEKQELSYLENIIDLDDVHMLLSKYLPYLSIELFDQCVQAIRPSSSLWKRIRISHRLQTTLIFAAQRSLPTDTFLKLWRRGLVALRRRLFNFSFKYKPLSGGLMIAIIGGDGAGKSTAVDGIFNWLSKNFDLTKIHMGKPKWSLTTIMIRTLLKVGQIFRLYPLEATFKETLYQQSIISPGYPWLLREVCRARDRYWTYRKAQKIALNGGIVIFDRFPNSKIKLMDGPLAEYFINQLQGTPQGRQLFSPRKSQWLAKYLIKLEKSYYQKFGSPDLQIVMRVNPEIAVQRKTDELSTSVRERSSEIWKIDWQNTDIKIMDASKPKSEILTDLKSLIWSNL